MSWQLFIQIAVLIFLTAVFVELVGTGLIKEWKRK